ncbi:hypothetical protein ZHAS_00003719 [Anopheles sinensis]|uniref:Uncharacterized protein n=1 Tax=Anopheles sinensis TaxID=74873 RepID=A0A084VFB6_ANOSI|nr:hypothetical protein ZHAS_00003719 [Anopheles sinensis]
MAALPAPLESGRRSGWSCCGKVRGKCGGNETGRQEGTGTTGFGGYLPGPGVPIESPSDS